MSGRPPPAPLPIDEAAPALIAALRDRGAAVLIAPPGSGKTTRAPLALLDAGLPHCGLHQLPAWPTAAERRCETPETSDENLGLETGVSTGNQLLRPGFQISREVVQGVVDKFFHQRCGNPRN